MSADNRFAPLPSELRLRKLLESREQQTGVQWSDSCPAPVGTKIRAALNMLTDVPERVLSEADRRRGYASDGAHFTCPAKESLGGVGDDVERLDCVAAVVYAFVWLAENDGAHVEAWNEYGDNSWEPPRYDINEFVGVVNDILLHGRVEWMYQDDKFQERGNSVLHAEVIRPTTILLDSDPKFRKASSGFQTALNRLSDNKPDVAITDAVSAVQEFFRSLGIDGNSISDQLDAAARAKVISSSDKKILKPLVDWSNADRSTRGNAHHSREGDVSKADAWLALHVAGALIVRLSNQEPRDIVAAREKRDDEAKRAAEERLLRDAEAERTAAPPQGPWDKPYDFSADTPF